MTQPQSRSKEIITAGGKETLPFSPAVKAGGLIYLSGTLGKNRGRIAAGDVRAQTRQALDNAGATLAAAGSSLASAASVMVYLRNASDFAAMNEVYATYWTSDPPARTTVVVTQPLADADGLIEVAMVAVPTRGDRTVVQPAAWVASPNPYSYAIKTGNTLFLSGLVSRDGRDNATVTGDVTAQIEVVLDNGAAILDAAGMSYADVVSARVFLTDQSAFAAMNAAYRPYFSSVPPARATVKAGLTNPSYFVEISMIAVKDDGRTAITVPNRDGTRGTPNPNLSGAILVGNRLYIAGVIGNTAANQGDVRAQTKEVLARVGRTLKEAEFTWSDVVDGIIYLPDMTAYQAMNASYGEIFSKAFPARAAIGAGLMDADAAVEIMFTAVRS